MTDYYVDPTATGNDDGTTWTDAWSTLQKAIDGTGGTQPGAGDTVYCKANGTTADETLSATIDMDGTSGSSTTGLVRFIGVNSSGVNDGTRYLINANSQSPGMLLSGNLKWLENFEVYNSGDDGFDWTNTGFSGWVLKNVVSRDNAGAGFDCYYSDYGPVFFIECQALDNDGDGWDRFYRDSARLIFCTGKGNGGKGFEGGEANPNYASCLIGCLFYENTGDNIDMRYGGLVMQCVSDASIGGDGIRTGDLSILIGNRITNNNTAGIDIDAVTAKMFCYLGGNGTDEVGTLGYNLLHKGATTVTTGGTDTNHGYNDPTNDDYSLKDTGVTYRRSAIDLEQ